MINEGIWDEQKGVRREVELGKEKAGGEESIDLGVNGKNTKGGERGRELELHV